MKGPHLEPKTIVCSKWGNYYNHEHVNNLYAMVKRNITPPFRFICFTDNPDKIHNEIEVVTDIDKRLKGWWLKVSYFKNPLLNIEGQVLALDLDLVIVDNIDCLFEYSKFDFVMLQNRPSWGSGIMRFCANQYPYIYDTFKTHKVGKAINNLEQDFKSHRFWGDQDWISHCLRERYVDVKTWKKEWVPRVSPIIKEANGYEVTIPKDAKILVFAGRRHEPSRYRGFLKKWWHSEDI